MRFEGISKFLNLTLPRGAKLVTYSTVATIINTDEMTRDIMIPTTLI